MDIMKYLLGAIGLLLGGFLFQKSKRISAEALLENQESKEKVQSLQAYKDKNNASLELEEQRRKDLEENAKEKMVSNPVDSDLLNFLNKPKDE